MSIPFSSDQTIDETIAFAQEADRLELDEFAVELAKGTQAQPEAVDEKIEKYAIGRRKNRISKVALAILRLAIYEMLFEEGIPVSVSINEAVELAKKYAGTEDASFINGLLGSVAQSSHAAEEENV